MVRGYVLLVSAGFRRGEYVKTETVVATRKSRHFRLPSKRRKRRDSRTRRDVSSWKNDITNEIAQRRCNYKQTKLTDFFSQK